MDFKEIRYEVADGVLTVTLDRPERLNAFTPVMLEELIEAFDRADADDEVRAIVVTGAGRAFCAGADLEAGGNTFDWREREADGDVPRDGGGRFALRVFASTKPVIAAINGPAVGVVELAEQRRVAARALDDVVRRAARQQPAVAHAEVRRLRVVGDQGQRGLL